MTREAYIFDAVRTPRGHGGEGGGLHQTHPVELVRVLLDALTARGVCAADVDDVILGCVTQERDQGANIARTAALVADWPVPGLTVARHCTSGLDAVGAAAARVMAGFDDVIVAGGVESMSRVPTLSDEGAWFKDKDIAEKTGFVHMGHSADFIAAEDGRMREALDQWALRSHLRAAAAWESGAFDKSVVPVRHLARDEKIRPDLDMEQLAACAPVMEKVPGREVIEARYPEQGFTPLHSALTAPAIVDGAALVLVAELEAGKRMGLVPRAKIRSFSVAASCPVRMLTGTVAATERALKRANIDAQNVHLYEVNESFSAPVLHFIDALSLDEARVNVHGGAIAMGHPLGASGAILTGTLVDALEESDDRIGVATLCAGAGLAASLVVEKELK